MQILSLREQEFRTTLQRKDQELKKLQVRKLLIDRHSQTDASAQVSPKKPPVPRQANRLTSFRQSFEVAPTVTM